MSRRASAILIALLVGGAYWRWFLPGVLSYGDWWFLSQKNLLEQLPFAPLWSASGGLGSFQTISAFSLPLHTLQGLLAKIGLGFAWSERLLWFWPFVVLAPLGAYLLFQRLFKNRVTATVAALFYSLNTYILTSAPGGHLTGGMGYALLPGVVWLCIRAWEEHRWTDRILAGLALAVQMQYDSRFTYLTLVVFGTYVLFRMIYVRKPVIEKQAWNLLWLGLTIGGIVLALNLYWILPAALASLSAPALPADNLDPGWIRILSYMDLGHALALFHPFWGGGDVPTGLHDPPWYFFIWPAAAFSAAFAIWRTANADFKKRIGDWRIIWLLFLALIATFLVMGAQAPIPGAYRWLFDHVPGFVAFRDPTKHYTVLALAYGGLIGVTVAMLGDRLVARSKPNLRRIARFVPLGVFCALLVFSVREAYLLQIGKTFTPRNVPASYVRFAEYVDRQPDFFRTLWVPATQRFAPDDSDHPAVSAVDAARQHYANLQVSSGQAESWLRNPNAEYLLSGMAVKYVVVPEDTEDDVFRNYESRDSYLEQLDQLPYLERLPGFDGLAVYENRHVANHVYAAATVDYFATRAAGIDFPRLDRLTGRYDYVADHPGLMFWNNPAADPRPQNGWRLPDMAQAVQDDGTLTVPFAVPVGGGYQLWAHGPDPDSAIESAIVETEGGSQVFRQDNPGQTIVTDDFGETVPVPADDGTAGLQQAGFTELGTVLLPPGPYRLQVNDESIQGGNDPHNASFEQPLPAELGSSSDHTDGHRSLQLSGREDRERITLTVQDFDPTATYRVTFDYKNVGGEAPWYGLDRIGVKDGPIRQLPLQGGGWQRFSKVVEPNEGSTGLRLSLLSAGRPGSFTINRFDNVRIRKLGDVDTLFLRTDGTAPQVTFERRSPTRYTVHVRGARNPFYLVFAESYHPGWRLDLAGQHSNSTIQTHTIMNGYANAWHLGQTGDYDLELTFAPQRLSYVGAGISGAALLAILTLLLWLRHSDRRARREAG